MTLLDEVLATYGGVGRWRQIETIVQEERAWHRPFTKPGLRSSFSPGRVAIETDDEAAQTIEELTAPRDSFAGHGLETPWSMLQLAYFAGYAMWTYLSEPYSFTFRGVRTEELGDWTENGQTWRRLGVRYPGTIATHSADQVIYVDSDGLLRRRDYQVDIAGGSPGAHYMDDHREVDGIVLPHKRVVHPRDEHGRPVADVATVTIDIHHVQVG